MFVGGLDNAPYVHKQKLHNFKLDCHETYRWLDLQKGIL